MAILFLISKMKFRYILFFTIIATIVFMLGCFEQRQKNATHTDSLLANKIETISTGELKAKLDCLEQLFNNDNYYFIQQKDTQFVYFTRLNDLYIFTHSYKMSNGDSTQLIIDTIKANSQNQIVWNWKAKHFLLDSVTNKTARWLNTTTSTTLKFNKNNIGGIIYTNETGSNIQLNKTPQISLFLSRSIYDYKNGTRYAFDKTNFSKR